MPLAYKQDIGNMLYFRALLPAAHLRAERSIPVFSLARSSPLISYLAAWNP
jgi:hypothetical protein